MQEHPHERLIRELSDQFRPILDGSPQAVMIYMDDYHKACNQRFSDMLGYGSPEEWAMMKTPVTDTTEDTRQELINAVMSAIQNMAASSARVSWKTRDGRILDTNCVVAPGSYKGQIYALQFFEA